MWDGRYNTTEYIFGKEPNSFLAENSRYFKGGAILSLAEGEGRNAVYLAGIAGSVTAVDSSEVGLKKAKNLAREKGVSITTVKADLTDYVPKPGMYTGIVSIFCHLPPKVRQDLHKRCITALKPGGIFLLEGYTVKQLEYRTGGPSKAEMMHSLEELRDSMFELEELHGAELVRPVMEGPQHHGDGAVVQFIARKP